MKVGAPLAIGVATLGLQGAASARDTRTQEIGLPAVLTTEAPGSSLNLVEIIEPIEIGEEDLDAVIALRSAYGLSTDREEVAELYFDPLATGAQRSATNLLGGIALAPHELLAADRRARAEWDAIAVNDVASANLGPLYAGVEISRDSLIVHCERCGVSDFERLESQLAGVETDVPFTR